MSRTITVDVHYPPQGGRIELHTEDDWEAALPADRVSDDGSCHSFDVALARWSLYFKPVLVRDDEKLWAQGENCSVAASDGTVTIYPHFRPAATWTVPDDPLDDEVRGYRVRAFLPPGYHENTLRRYPVVYLHDGPQLFFPDEPLADVSSRIRETAEVLGTMSLLDPVIAVAISPNDREIAYTRPGYLAHADFLVGELVPKVDALYRLLPEPENTAVMGSGLGGVAAFYLAWEWPGVFGLAACLSSSFGLRDNLFERVATESRRDTRLYLDSGWPGDNCEPTRTMVDLLRSRGHQRGDLCSFVFPEGRHNTISPAMRAHLPLQFFFGDRRPR